jgi:cell division protease FtsH
MTFAEFRTTFPSETQGRDYSEATAAKIDGEVQRLLGERHKAVYELLTRERERLDCLVETLLHEETVGQDVLAERLGRRPEAPSQNGGKRKRNI